MSILTEALLANVTITQWSGRRYDKNASEWVAHQYKSEKTAARVNKMLVPQSFLKPIDTAAINIRKVHKSATLLWMDDGYQMLPAVDYMDYLSKYNEAKMTFDTEVRNLDNNFDSMVEASKGILGDLYDPRDIPDKDRLLAKFSCQVTVIPIPAKTDWRINKLHQTDQLIDDYSNKMDQLIKDTRQYFIDKIIESLITAKHKIETAKRLHKSVMSNISNACSDVMRRNVIGDDDIKMLAMEILQIIEKLPVEHVKVNKGATAHILDSLIKKSFTVGGIPTPITEPTQEETRDGRTFGRPAKNDQDPHAAHITTPFFRSFSA